MANTSEPSQPLGHSDQWLVSTSQPKSTVSRRMLLAAGLALIVLPLLAWVFKLMSFGWLIVIILFGPIVLLVIGYVMQIVVAAQGFLRPKNLFGARTLPATLAAWGTSVSVVLLAIFIPDGGDSDHGSTLQVWLGAYGPNSEAVHAAMDTLTSVLATIAAIVWLATWVWLIVEWIIALRRRVRAKLDSTQPVKS